MLTKSANKVYLLSYNACETQVFRCLRPGFDILKEGFCTQLYRCLGFDLLSDQTRNRPDLASGPAFSANQLVDQYYSFLH